MDIDANYYPISVDSTDTNLYLTAAILNNKAIVSLDAATGTVGSSYTM